MVGEPSEARPRRALITRTITVPRNLARACEEFNGRLFFECHESIEEIWQEEPGPVRDLYKGLIQVAAGFVHVTRANSFGSHRLFTTALGYLEPYRRHGAMGFDVDAICAATEQSRAQVIRLGEALARFDYASMPHYVFDGRRLGPEAQCWGAWGFDAAGTACEMEIQVSA